MIRRDYILRMIQEFAEALSRIRALKQDRQWQETGDALDEQFKLLVGAGPQALARLSETELLAKLVQGEPTHVVHHKTLLLTTLLKEAGDLAAAQDRAEESRACYLKGLRLLLDVLGRLDADECPDFVPKVELFVEALKDSPLPPLIQALLMQHYERTGQFARAEDALFAILDAQPDNADALEFGISFYKRLADHSDAALAQGNLQRPELEAGRAELQQRRTTLAAGNRAAP